VQGAEVEVTVDGRTAQGSRRSFQARPSGLMGHPTRLAHVQHGTSLKSDSGIRSPCRIAAQDTARSCPVPSWSSAGGVGLTGNQRLRVSRLFAHGWFRAHLSRFRLRNAALQQRWPHFDLHRRCALDAPRTGHHLRVDPRRPDRPTRRAFAAGRPRRRLDEATMRRHFLGLHHGLGRKVGAACAVLTKTLARPEHHWVRDAAEGVCVRLT
jgi:hypothetical protein